MDRQKHSERQNIQTIAAGAASRTGEKKLRAWLTGWRGALLLFLFGLALAGAPAFLGNTPFGAIAAAAVSGTVGAAAVSVGAVLGGLANRHGTGAVLPLITLLLFAARGILSLCLLGRKEYIPLLRSLRKQLPAPRAPTLEVRRKNAVRGAVLENGGTAAENVTASSAPAVSPSGDGERGGRRRASRDGPVSGAAVFRLLARRQDSEKGEGGVRTLVSWAAERLYREPVLLRVCLGAIAVLLGGAWGLAHGGWSYAALFRVFLCVLLSAPAVYLLYAATERSMRYSVWRESGVLAMVTAGVFALSSHAPAGWNLGEAAAACAAILAGSSFGVSRGCLTGLVCGAVLTPLYAPGYALAGVTAGLGARTTGGHPWRWLGEGRARALTAAFGAVVGCAWSVYAGGGSGLVRFAPETLLVTALLLPLLAYDGLRLPGDWCGMVQDTRRGERAALAETVLRGRETRLHTLGENLEALGTLFAGVAEKTAAPNRAALRRLCADCFSPYCAVCSRAARGESCQKTEKHAWESMLRNVADALAAGGAAARAIPPRLASRCTSMGKILEDCETAAAGMAQARRQGDGLRVAAEDYRLLGKLLTDSAATEAEEGEPDAALTAKLRRVLSWEGFEAGHVSAYGTRHKRIFVHDVHLAQTRLGGEEIRRLFSGIAGMPLSAPVFSLDGAVLSMELHSTARFSCAFGSAGRSLAQKRAEQAREACGQKDEMFVQTDEKKPAWEEDAGAPSGDTVVRFDGGGNTYLLLSDGMGTGRMAALTSGVSASFLERLLTAGVRMEQALKMLNHVLRAGCEECSTTIDLCRVDCTDGEARFVKSGAAPSFVIRGDSLFRLQSKTVPIGILRALDAEMLSFQVMEGDTIVMLSDGITKSFEDCPWLYDLLTTDDAIRSGDVQAAAEHIVQAASRHGADDDITAGILRVLPA